MGDRINIAGFDATVTDVKNIGMGWHRVEFRNSGSIGSVDFRSDAEVLVNHPETPQTTNSHDHTQ